MPSLMMDMQGDVSWVLAGGAGIDLPIWRCKPPELQR